MPEDIIKGRIVFEGGGLAGGVAGAAGGSAATMTGSIMSKRGMMGAVTLPITDVLGQIAKGISKLGQISPILGAEFLRLRKGLSLFLMPIGDTIANWVRPMAQSFLESAAVFYEEYKNNGLATAIAGALAGAWNAIFPLNPDGTLNYEGVIENINSLVDIAGVISFTILGISAGITAAAWFIAASTAAGATGFLLSPLGLVAISAALLFAGKSALEFSGLSEWHSTLLSAVGVAFGIGVAALTATTLGSGVAIAIPVALVAMWVMGKGLKSHLDAGQVIDDGTGDLMSRLLSSPDALENPTLATEDLGTAISVVAASLGPFFSAMQDGWNWLVDKFTKNNSPPILELFPMLGDSMVSAWTDKLQPSFLSMQEGIINAMGKVLVLDKALNDLPNIERTITYTIHYVVED